MLGPQLAIAALLGDLRQIHETLAQAAGLSEDEAKTAEVTRERATRAA